MLHISWKDHVNNEDVLMRAGREDVDGIRGGQRSLLGRTKKAVPWNVMW